MEPENKFRGGMLKNGLSITWPFVHLTISDNNLQISEESFNKVYDFSREKIVELRVKRWFPLIAEGLHIKYKGKKYSEDIYFWVMPKSFKRLKSQLAKYKYIHNDLKMDDENGNCKQCGHPFDPHLLITEDSNNPVSGIIRCPVEGCKCHSTWGLESK